MTTAWGKGGRTKTGERANSCLHSAWSSMHSQQTLTLYFCTIHGVSLKLEPKEHVDHESSCYMFLFTCLPSKIVVSRSVQFKEKQTQGNYLFLLVHDPTRLIIPFKTFNSQDLISNSPLSVCHIVLVMLVWRIWYWINL